VEHNGEKFSTQDNDNDSHKDKSVNCATMLKGDGGTVRVTLST